MNNMNSNDLQNVQIKKRRRRKWYYTVSLTMAAIVVFCTVYALILPAITMEKEQQALICQLNVHQHTAQCYDSDNNLICGETDFVIHTHDDGCFGKDGNKVCKLPEVVVHKHVNSCYDKKGKLICKLPEVEEHKHNNLCYDKDGTLICGKLQTIRHVHGTACFNSPRSTDDEAVEDMIMPLSDTAGSSETYGYGEDGSIWWNGRLEYHQVPFNEIKENTRYIISGLNDNNLMADETYTKGDATYLKAIPKQQMTDYTQYQRWYFEKANEDGKYYIYFLKTNEDNSTTPLYLQFADYGVVEWNNKTQQTALTNDKTLATVFTVAQCTDSSYPNHITIGADVDGSTFFVNSYFGDRNNGSTTHWLGYEEYSGGCFLRVGRYDIKDANTANRVETDTSANTVINLFDYWLTPNRTDPDNLEVIPSMLDTGINNGHDFKFTMGSSYGSYPLNYWTGSGKLPRQGVVSPNLENGYPVLSGDNQVNGTTSKESLRYLFDTTYQHEGKASYRNVGGLLKLDKDDYYSYDCNKNMAEYNEQNNTIYLYDKPGVAHSGYIGQFFPFNKAPQIMTAGRTDSVMNHYFGMTITTRFIQRHDGYTSSDKKTKTTFHFSGDDDVWIFIDGVLVGDVGGIHDASSVDIDFATGEIQVAVAGGTKADKITIKQCYQNAGKDSTVAWNGDTYANNTTHTLKFFYLERGNYDSNLELKFNLTEVPRTAIKKTNEYGEAVSGAKFAVYAADSSYNMLKDKGDTAPVSLPNEISYDENGNILDSSGQILANALYVGTTNDKGELVFLDQDSMPYTIRELNDLFGDNFILRELSVPEGYRIVSKSVHLRIFQGDNQKILMCDNYKDSGTRAATDLQITATDTIHLKKTYTGTKDFKGQTAIPYCDPDTGKPVGTLFAVVLKYTGEVDENGNMTGSISDEDCWTPVYGSDEKGYHLIDRSNGKGIVEASIEAANEAVKMAEKDLADNPDNNPTNDPNKKYEGVVFSRSKSNSSMQLLLGNLPGHITEYYSMLSSDQKEKTKYTVGYFWTDMSKLEYAKPENTYGVETYPSILAGDIPYSGFERIFSAEIQVPNLINDVFVQKVDEDNKLINGATFAMYQVKQSDSGEILYRAEDENGAISYVPAPKTEPATEPAEEPSAEPVAESATEPTTVPGIMKVDDKTITPVKTGVTSTLSDGIHTGSIRFMNLPEGQYIIKEVSPPPGYSLNKSDIMVLVTSDTIYANAGTEDDGVTVGRGPGYLVTPLHQFASEGQLDNTLTWIYAQMQISEPSTSFADVGDKSKIKGYLTKNYSSETTKDQSQAFITDLIYAKDKAGTAFNYVPDPLRNKDTDTDGYRRLFTTSGWPYYEIYQDYDYGSAATKESGVHYEKWSDSGEVTNLFSRSSYIRVTDKNEVALKVKKVDASNKEVTLSDAQFRLYRLNSENEKEYYFKEIKDNKDYVSWITNADAATVVTTGADGMGTDSFTKLKDGTFYLEEIKAPNGYDQPSKPIELKIEMSKMTLSDSSKCSVDDGVLDENNFYTYTVTIPNHTGYELPATGGSGTFMYTAGGILLVSISLVYGYRRKRRSERRFK